MDNNEISRISRGLYATVNDIIGPKEIIEIRRTATQLADDFREIKTEWFGFQLLLLLSGSKAEGYRFQTSDSDYMFVNKNIRVIPSASFSTLYDRNKTLLIMENEMTKSGFSLLRLISNPSNQCIINSSRVSFLNGCYISSTLWRELHNEIPILFENRITHGPCTSDTFGPLEFDIAYCVKSDIWPKNAGDCIRRLHQCSWPTINTIHSIMCDGILFVAIGAKQSVFENVEWRMSFSLAEKKLIYAMNETQFLCYGLLKIFLKEAIDVNVHTKGLLCSFFMKTAVFWEITSSPNNWNPSSLLSCF